MPLLKPVRRLYYSCINAVNKALIDSLDKIILNVQAGGSYSELQEWLTASVHPDMIEILLHEIDGSQLTEAQKIAILEVYRHSNLKKVDLQFKLPTAVSFYEKYLVGLNKLVVLNLTKVCTDEILEIVGENCPLLEIIHIISKTESESNKGRRTLNALKLKFFVSDDGLKHLSKCKLIKRIYMDKMIRSSCGGRKITHGGLVSLLQNLPYLSYISYEDMGLILEEMGNKEVKLSLVHVHDNHVTPGHISLFSRLCPSLTTLCLSVPTMIQDPTVCGRCLEELSLTELNVKNLVLRGFPFDSSLESFLNLRGEFIKILSLDHDSTITTESIFIIGMRCPNLEHLAVKLLHPGQVDLDLTLSSNDVPCFNYLKSLKIFGVNWNPYVVLKLCLLNSKRIESLCIFNKYFTQPLDDLFELLCSKNSFSTIKYLGLLEGFKLSVATLVQLLLHCNNLAEITFSSNSEYGPIVEDIIRQSNFDLVVKIDNVPSFGNCLCQKV